MNLFRYVFEKAARRAGLVKQKRKVSRNGKITYEDRWVRPEEAGQVNMFGGVSSFVGDGAPRDQKTDDIWNKLTTKAGTENGRSKRKTSRRNIQTQRKNSILPLFSQDTGSVAPAESESGKDLAEERELGREVISDVGKNEGTRGADGDTRDDALRSRVRSGTDGEPSADNLTDNTQTPIFGGLFAAVMDTVPDEPSESDINPAFESVNGQSADQPTPSPIMPPPEIEAPPNRPAFQARGLAAQEKANTEDFVITDEVNVGSGNLQQKTQDNLAALDLLKTLEDEHRKPTLDEKKILARYVGWGAFGQIFHPGLKSAVESYRSYEWYQGDHSSPEPTYRDNLDWDVDFDEIEPHLSYNMISGSWRKHFNLAKELRKRMTPEQWEEAWASSRNAFYTSPAIVRTMWDAIEKMGFGDKKKLNVLEPGCGTGNFLGLQPESLRAKSRRTGVELDSTTAKIAQYLYPASRILNMGLQDTHLQNNKFDIVIGNPPFGGERVFDQEYSRSGKKLLTQNIHSYFVSKSLDKLKPGGVLAFVISRHFMDSQKGTTLREHLQDRANFLGAVRLPSDAFEENSGTSVTTDIIFLQKRDLEFESKHPRGADGRFVKKWINTDEDIIYPYEEDHSYGEAIHYNEYFKEHPENVLGEFSLESGMYSKKDFGVKRAGYSAEEFPEKLQQAIEQILPEPIVNPSDGDDEVDLIQEMADEARYEAAIGMDEGRYHIDDDGVVHQVRGGALIPVEFVGTKADPEGKEKRDRLVPMIQLTETLKKLNSAEVNPDTDEDELKVLRNSLNEQYNGFVRKYGRLHDARNIRAFEGKTGQAHDNVSAILGSPDAGLLLALEIQDRNTKEWGKADIFDRRVVDPVVKPKVADTVEDAYGISLNETGGLDWKRMSSLMDKEPEDIRDELADKKLIYRDPATQDDEQTQGWIPADEYLSGNVVKKLAVAREYAKEDPSFEPNVEALEAVQPERIAPGDIDIKLGVSWVPTEYYEEFIQHLFNFGYSEQKKSHVRYNAFDSSWGVPTIPSGSYDRNKVDSSEFGTKRINALKLLEVTMNGKMATINDKIEENGKERYVINMEETMLAREKQRKLQEAFQEYMMTEVENPGEWADIYNDLFNNHRQRDFDGSHLTFPGMSNEYSDNLRDHMKNFVWRAIQDGSALADHVVGAGKTIAGAATAMELKRLGLANKPMIVVPCNLVEQWDASFRDFYPQAKILTVWDKDWTPAKRKEMTSRIATGNWDAVIISHTAFGSIPLSEKSITDYFEGQMTELRQMLANEGDDKTAKQLRKQIDSLETTLKEKLDKLKSQKDVSLPWDQLGVDTVISDEFHMFKNLYFNTRQNRLPGIGGGESGRAMDMFIKTQDIMRKNEGRGLIGLTGTPVSNSLTEMYTLCRYFKLPELKEQGVANFDAWLQNFAHIDTKMEAAPEGGYRERTRVRQFTNMPELSTMYRSFADVKTQEDLDLPIPELAGGTPNIVVSEPSDELVAYMDDLQERALTLMGKDGRERPDPSKDNFLKLTSDARKASLDMRLVEGHENAPDDPNSKVNRCVSNVADIYKRRADENATQLIFLDMSTPKGKNETKDHPRVAEARRKAYNRALADGKSDKDAKKIGNAAASQTKKDIKAEQQSRRLEARSGAEAAKKDAEEAARENGLPAKEVRAAGAAAKKDFMDAWKAEHEDKNRMDSPDNDIENSEELHQKHVVYEDIKSKLIEQGIPEHKIAFAHDFNSDEKRREMQDRVNNGDIRILLGSTGKMGTGLNVQERLYAAHHLDCPWKPSDIEQREGRIIRQGNMYHDMDVPVEIHRYATKGSFDEFMWQQIETKAKFIAQARRGSFSGRTMEDIDNVELQAAAMKAASSNEPWVAELNELEMQQHQLESLRRAHINELDRLGRRVKELPGQIATHNALRDKFAHHSQVYGNYLTINPDFQMKVGGRTYTDRAEAGKALREAHRQTKDTSEGVPVGKYAGYDVFAHRDRDTVTGQNKPYFTLRTSDGTHVATAKTDSTENNQVAMSLERAMRSLSSSARYHEQQAAAKNDELTRGQARLSKKDFERQGELDQVKQRIEELSEQAKTVNEGSMSSHPDAMPTATQMSATESSGFSAPKEGKSTSSDTTENDSSDSSEPLLARVARGDRAAIKQMKETPTAHTPVT